MNENVDSTLIPFGLRSDRMVAVRDVASGLACGCICPACRSPLVARKGPQRRHHFAHAVSNPNCKYGPETAIHRMAKQCLLDAQRIMLPAYTWTATASDEVGQTHSESAEICQSARISFDRTAVEQQFAELRPDVIGWAQDQPILVEIAVGNPVSGTKLERLRAAGVACIEIDLSREDRESLTQEKLHELVVESVRLKRWLSHPDLERIRSALEEHVQTKAKKADQNRRAARSTWTLQPTRWASTRPRRPEPSPVSTDRKEPDRRILICESCRAVHDLGPYRESLTISKFDCTHCGEHVSLANGPMRQHHF
jgi:transposase-like protein